MCGITGIVVRQGTPDREPLRRASELIAHRGPDSSGELLAEGVGLAHRRLSIIDLSPAGAQPMADSTGRYAIVFNGEIYDYKDLRAELEKKGVAFRSSSDTEAVIEGYRLWGAGILERLRGMFALAIWDKLEKKLFIARDRIGKKPLFYAPTPGGGLAFASELKALAPFLKLEPDRGDLRLFVGLQYVPSPRTGFKGVRQLGLGECGVWKDGKLEISRYRHWEMPAAASGLELSEAEIDGKIRSILEDAVKLRLLAADVPVGAFLSGGVDSAAVVALASRHVKNLRTFTMGFPEAGFDERAGARLIASRFGTEHLEMEAKPGDLEALADEVVGAYDAPYADSSALPLMLLSRETARHIKVVLSGDGGDELFGGYRRYVAYERARRLAAVPLAARALGALGSALSRPEFSRMGEVVSAFRQNPAEAYGEMFIGSYFGSGAARRMFDAGFLKETETDEAKFFVSETMAGRDDPAAAMFFDLTSYLPDDLNVKMDRATMRYGLEARAPFLDQEMIKFALTLPVTQKVAGGRTKVALKRALAGLVPEETLRGRKAGFQVPLSSWFRKDRLRKMYSDRCVDPRGPLAGIVNFPEAARLIAENDRGVDRGNRLWMLLVLATWLEAH